MGTAPGKVIRSLRLALDMTQAEFARAAGWSPSTISSWERGTARPSRLAFKTILAFAEERGVRYQPKGEGSAPAPADGATLPVLRLSSRLASPPLTVLDAGREESFGSRRWTEIAAHTPAAAFPARATSFAERPEWQVDARLHLRIGTGREGLRRPGYVAASLLALAIGLGAGILIRTGLRADSARDLVPSAVIAPAAAPAPPVAAAAPASAPNVEVDELALAALAAPPFAVEPADAPSAPVRERPAPSLARLESIVALDGVRRASFRVGDRVIALVEGDDIGGRTVVAIANDEVTLVGSGIQRRVRLGSETPLE